MLTVREASARSGVPTVTISRACRAGRLPSVKGSATRGQGGQGFAYYVDPVEFDRWAARRQQAPVPWSDADTAALIELNGSCTAKQLGEYLGRSEQSVWDQRQKLIALGELDRKRVGSMAPGHIPASGILIAKSCIRCGKLRDARYYSRDNGVKRAHYKSYCAICLRAQTREAGREKRRQGYRPNVEHHNRSILQDATFAVASNERKRYTDDEVELILDPEQNEFGLALKLGRSYGAICAQRSSRGFYVRHPHPKRQRRLEDVEAWLINFTEANLEQRERFREVGLTAPEALLGEWPDWTDEAAS